MSKKPSLVIAWFTYLVLASTSILVCHLFIILKEAVRDTYAAMTVGPSRGTAQVLAIHWMTFTGLVAFVLVVSLGLTIRFRRTHWIALANLFLSLAIFLAAFIALCYIVGADLIPTTMDLNDSYLESGK